MANEKVEQIKILIKDSYYASKEARDLVFKEYDNKQNQIIASSFINKAISLISAAKAIYYSDLENLERIEINEIFNQFDIFESEFMSNYSTDHSHQHTDIEFNQFKEAVEIFLDV